MDNTEIAMNYEVAMLSNMDPIVVSEHRSTWNTPMDGSGMERP